MDNKELDRLFRDTFKDTEEKPKDSIWHNIEAVLDQQQQKAVPLQRKKGFHWLYYAAAASVLVAFGIVVWTIQIAERTGEGQKIVIQSSLNKPQNHAVENPALPRIETRENESIGPGQPQKQEIIAATIQPMEKQETKSTVEAAIKFPDLDLEGIESTAPTQLGSLTTVKNTMAPPAYRVTEIDDIKPLIEPEEEMESMYASATPDEKGSNTIVTSLLNSISGNLEISNTKDIRFHADEEGSLRIDILNSLVKNRNKKRR